MASALVLNDVTKRYGDGPAVVDGLSHTFTPGTLTLLVGPNGAGKTTLLRLLSVLAYPTTGTVRYDDLDVHAHPHRYLQQVGLVHAGSDLPEHLSAVELLEWILRSRGHWTDDAPERIAALLDRLQLDERRTNLIGTYSSGMVQKTQIAAALVADPAVLLMDEPLRSLDTATTDATVDLIERFVTDGGLAIIASHLTDALAPLADTSLTLRTNEPAESGPAPKAH
jgi:ABC-type multidrug transport system ATPase subunit